MKTQRRLLFLVYSPLSSSSIEHSLGMADYSYYFVMQRFLPLLREFGEVELLERVPTDDEVALRQQAHRCVYLSFTPPNKVAALSRCPVLPVFAWEYSTLPDEAFSSPEDNWVRALRRSGSAITHSQYSLAVVRSQLGADYPIESIPAPIWDSYQGIRETRRKSPPRGLDGLNLDCTIIDSNDYLISNTAIRPRQDMAGSGRRLLSERWSGEPLAYRFAAGEQTPTLIGFNDAEPWGVWSRSGYPWVLFDCAIDGEIELRVRLRGYLQNIGKRLRLEMGGASADLLLSELMQTHVFRLSIEHPTNVLAFVGVVERAVGAADPRDIGLGLAEISIRRPAPAQAGANALEAPAPQAASPGSDSPEIACLEIGCLEIDMAADALVCAGLYDCEPPGRWTSSADVAIQLPVAVAGNFRMVIDVFHILHNHGRQVDVSLGAGRQALILEDGRSSYELDFTAIAPTDYIAINGLGLGPGEHPDDPRWLGLGIARISLRPLLPEKQAWNGAHRARALLASLRDWPAPRNLARRIRTPRSVLYTAIFNPKDGRKNWEDIITAFVYAFREDAGATLLIKITYHELDELYEDIFTFLIQLHPFRCRLVFIHGYLSQQQYEQLLLHSHFIVNASRGEGQCLPLMEFMSAGVPAVAPCNSAMREYITPRNAFIVESSPELTFWPQDPRQVFRTLWQRIDWESLVGAFAASARLYRKSRRRYRALADAAALAQQAYCSMAVARSRFEKVLGQLPRDAGQ